MFFSVITKKLNQEISTKNLVTFKRWDGFKDENLWGFTEKSDFQVGGFTKKHNIGRNCLKRGTWTVYRFRGGGGGLAKKREVRGHVFEGMVLIHQCTLHTSSEVGYEQFPIEVPIDFLRLYLKSVIYIFLQSRQ